MDQLEITSNFFVSKIPIKFDVMNLFESNLYYYISSAKDKLIVITLIILSPLLRTNI